MSYLFLASLGARVSFIVAATQELVSTPSCINKNRDTSLARRFPNFKELFLFFRMFAEFTQCGHWYLHHFMVDSLVKLENYNFDKKNH